MASRPSASAGERDLRLDFFRGLALFSIFVDHIPGNVARHFTLQATGLMDAAEVFILISGYAAGMVYGAAFATSGFVIATARVYHRVWQLYVAHVFLFMLFMATVAQATTGLNRSLFAEEFRATDFLAVPDVAVIKALTLQFQPMFMDILPVYIALLAILPLALVGFARAPLLVFAGSALLWFAVQFDPRIALPAYPGEGHVWFFNPFAWQALFLAAAYLGSRGAAPDGAPPAGRKWLFRTAVAVAVVCFLVKTSWTVHDHFEAVPALFVKFLGPFLSKTDLSPVRFANVLALAIVATCLIGKQAAFFSSRIAWPFMVCGRHSLEVFCLSILLSVLAHLGLTEFFADAPLQVAASLAGLAVLIAVAALIDWFGKAKSAARRGAADRETVR